ncbi:MAG: TonB-dependent receptor plug domain-containing protein [Ignavibacteriaceae bacterium]|nr:TonB-dependent receptor plug domain-containing protein [Ignavibacteriaceae bacterium]
MFIKTTIVFISASFLLYSQEIGDTTVVITESLVISDSIAVSDSLIIKDSILVYDSAIVFPKHLSENSFEVKRDIYLRNDYKYAGDLFEPFQFNFIKDLGFPGQPNETFIYGLGFTGIGYLLDGILVNDRRSNGFDLNLIQSEDIETIEIIPSPKGFLFSSWNNPVALNFITRDFIPAQPYSRIKYYQGPDGEAMVDGSFNAAFSKNFLLSFDVTNRKYDSTYANTAFSTWQAKVKAKYFFSTSLYLTAAYNYADKKTGLSGGVDRDSIFALGWQLDNLLYDPDFAPVNSPFLIKNDLLHFTSLRLNAIQSEDSRTEFTLYHQFKESKTNDTFNTELDNTTFGVNLYQVFKYRPFSFNATGSYERNKLEAWYSGDNSGLFIPYDERTVNFFSLAGIVSLNLLEDLTPSVFYKISKSSSESAGSQVDVVSSGFGADVTYKPIEDILLYVGYSMFDKTFFEDDKTTTFETGLRYKTENIFADVKYFRRDNTNIFLGAGIPAISANLYEIGNISGLGLSANVIYWYLQLETQTSAYFANEEDLYSIPDFRFIGGLYFRGNLFQDNLNLKTGLKFTYTGNINSLTEQYGLLAVDSSNKLDFILSGEIRKAAILYFTWENLLGNEYYITPFYPMPGGSIRFGLAWELLN